MQAIGAASGRAAAWRRRFAVTVVVSVVALTVTGANSASRFASGTPDEYQSAVEPTVAFDGTNYLVVWAEARAVPEGGSYSDIYAARVSPAGAVLDPAGIAISSADWEQTEPAVAFDGTNYLVTWMDRRSGTNTDIYGARVSQAGAVLDPAGIAISTTASFEQQPAVAFDGTNQLVAWGDGGRIYGARVSPAGAVLDPAGIEISANGDYPTVAFDGTNYLVAWAAGGYEIFGARVSPPGTVLDPGGIVISARVGSRGEESPALAFNGTNYLVAWEAYEPGDYYDSFGARVSPAGAVRDPSGIAISTAAYNQRAPSVASDGTNHLVAWQDSRTGTNWDLYGARLSQAGAVLDPAGIAISTAEGHQVEPAVAFDGTNYLVVWENFAGDHRIYGARLSQVGAGLRPGRHRSSRRLLHRRPHLRPRRLHHLRRLLHPRRVARCRR